MGEGLAVATGEHDEMARANTVKVKSKEITGSERLVLRFLCMVQFPSVFI
jgi:hypothetical protein